MHRTSLGPLAPVLVLTALIAAGCAGTEPVASVTTARPSATAPAAGAALDPAAFSESIARPGTVVLDVRTPAEFAGGHLQGARNIDIESPRFEESVSALPREATYAVYCRTGNRSARALDDMRGLGFGDIYHLAGGISAWESAGGEVVPG